jgi:hypothetical protein
MNLRRYSPIRSKVPVIAVLFSSLALCACAQTVTEAPASFSLSPQEKSELIERLDMAKRADWSDALDPSVAPVTQEDFLSQMNKADRVIKELKHGFPVPREEIADALWIPPKSIRPGERTHLIGELQEAEREDDHNEQLMLISSAWTDSVAPVDTMVFDQQELLVESVVKDLEIGEGGSLVDDQRGALCAAVTLLSDLRH